jgi:hypothetical protein
MIAENSKECLKAAFCCCVKPSRSGHELFDDDRFVTTPEYVGAHILLWGKKNSRFPYQCFLGPDWPVVLLTYALIIGVNVIVLSVVSPIGWPFVVVGAFTCLILLYFYSATVGTDSGIIFKQYEPVATSVPACASSNSGVSIDMSTLGVGADEKAAEHSPVMGLAADGDVESGSRESRGESDDMCDSTKQLITSDHSKEALSSACPPPAATSSSAAVHPAGGFTVYDGQGSGSAVGAPRQRLPPITIEPYIPAVPTTIECGQCELQRPYSARHCTYCKACIDNLDHHCPWCGKCIGEKNINQFYCFVGWLQFQMYYLFALFIYFLVSSAVYS